ncbi:MAG: prolyl oligopeptidase family serine peptidase [Pseudomonadota bacterium]
MVRYWVVSIFILALSGSLNLNAQTSDTFDPSGYWTGAIIKNDSILPIELEVSSTQDGFQARTTFPDWIFYRPFGYENVIRTQKGLIIEDLLSGDAVLELETRFEQLIGTVGDDGRRLHLKRAPAPPRSLVASVETSFISADGTRISGTLTYPEFGDNLSGMVMVRGRGCATRLNGRAQFLANYGMAVLTFDKRGAGQSEGDCETFTFEELTEDAIAAFEHLASQPKVDAERVGFFGESAGAWTIQAAAERQRQDGGQFQPAFLITWIGPSTSIIQQQISSAETYGESVGLSKERQELLAQVSRIIVDTSLSDDEAYHRLAEIRRKAEAEGWLEQGFGGDDIPQTREDMSKLWLRRFSYDPANFLQNMEDLPYLAVFGAKDTIVPIAENVQALKNTGLDVEIVILEESGHGYDFSEQMIDLPSGRAFWLYEGPDTGFTIETLDFLRRRGFLLR